jgi:hypothetical protein
MIKFNKTNKNMLRIKVFCNVTTSECPDVSNDLMPSYSTAEDSLKTMKGTNPVTESLIPEGLIQNTAAVEF